MSAIYEITKKLRDGTLSTKTKIPPFKKVVHVGHSFGSALTYELVAKYPSISDGIVLTGFSANGSYLPMVSAGMNWQLAKSNSKRFKHLPNGYVTWADEGNNQYGFFKPGRYVFSEHPFPFPGYFQEAKHNDATSYCQNSPHLALPQNLIANCETTASIPKSSTGQRTTSSRRLWGNY